MREDWTVLPVEKSGLVTFPITALVGGRTEVGDFTRELVRVDWRGGDPIDLYVIRPKGIAKAPVIVYLYSYPDDGERFMDDGWCARAVKGGFAAVGFVPALSGGRYHSRAMKEWFVSELPEAVGSTMHDVQMVINYLASRGDVETDRVGVFGQGSGGTVAVLAASVEPRIAVLDLVDPWGDWPDWLKKSSVVPENERPRYVTPKFLSGVSKLDPVDYLHGLGDRKLRLQIVETNTSNPPATDARWERSLPSKRDLVLYKDLAAHMTAYKSGGGLSGWIKSQLRPEVSAP